MNILGASTLFLLALTSACAAATPVVPSLVTAPRAVGPGDRVFSTVACVLAGDPHTASCVASADLGGVDPAAIARGDASALERLGESLGREARHRRVPLAQRAALAGWLELATRAALEARSARAGARCETAIASEGRNAGHPVLADVEAAWGRDRNATRTQEALVRLFAWIPDAGSAGIDAEATALVILADRIDAAAQARPEVHEEAGQAIDGIVSELARLGNPLAAGGRHESSHLDPARAAPSVAAHAQTDATQQQLQDLHARIVLRMRELASHVDADGLRAALEQGSEPPRLP